MNKYSKTIFVLFLLLSIISFASAAVTSIKTILDPEISPSSSSAITIGSYVQVYNTGGTGVLVRSPNACDASIANKPDGAKGTVTSSSTFCNSFDRVKVRFEDGVGDIFDVVKLVEHVFRGGAEPNCVA